MPFMYKYGFDPQFSLSVASNCENSFFVLQCYINADFGVSIIQHELVDIIHICLTLLCRNIGGRKWELLATMPIDVTSHIFT